MFEYYITQIFLAGVGCLPFKIEEFDTHINTEGKMGRLRKEKWEQKGYLYESERDS